MTEKAKPGRPQMPESERRRNTINVRLDDAAHSEIAQAASEAGRSLSGEIQYRVSRYDDLVALVDALLPRPFIVQPSLTTPDFRPGAWSPVTEAQFVAFDKTWGMGNGA